MDHTGKSLHAGSQKAAEAVGGNKKSTELKKKMSIASIEKASILRRLEKNPDA